MNFIFHPISSLNLFVARIVTDQLTLLISVIFFVILSLNYKKAFWRELDGMVSDWAENAKNSFLKNHAEDFALFGNAIFHILFMLILSIIFLITKHRLSTVFTFLFVLIFSWGLNRFMKIIFKRTRPTHIDLGIRRRLSYCYPSGHVMASIPIYFFSSLVLQSLVPFIPWYLIGLIISFLVIMSRIYLNHHFFTDILGGISMGILCLNISIWFYFFVGLV